MYVSLKTKQLAHDLFNNIVLKNISGFPRFTSNVNVSNVYLHLVRILVFLLEFCQFCAEL